MCRSRKCLGTLFVSIPIEIYVPIEIDFPVGRYIPTGLSDLTMFSYYLVGSEITWQENVLFVSLNE